MDRKTLLFLDTRSEERVAVRVFVLLAAIVLLIFQKFIQEARWLRLYPWIFIQRLTLRFRVQLVVRALWEVEYLRLRISTLSLQLRDHGGQRHGQGHVDQRWPGKSCGARGKLDPRTGHGRYGGEGLGPGEVGQPWVWKLHLREGGWCRGHRYGLKQQEEIWLTC